MKLKNTTDEVQVVRCRHYSYRLLPNEEVNLLVDNTQDLPSGVVIKEDLSEVYPRRGGVKEQTDSEVVDFLIQKLNG